MPGQYRLSWMTTNKMGKMVYLVYPSRYIYLLFVSFILIVQKRDFHPSPLSCLYVHRCGDGYIILERECLRNTYCVRKIIPLWWNCFEKGKWKTKLLPRNGTRSTNLKIVEVMKNLLSTPQPHQQDQLNCKDYTYGVSRETGFADYKWHWRPDLSIP
jgi:hypothetical protein